MRTHHKIIPGWYDVYYAHRNDIKSVKMVSMTLEEDFAERLGEFMRINACLILSKRFRHPRRKPGERQSEF